MDEKELNQVELKKRILIPGNNIRKAHFPFTIDGYNFGNETRFINHSHVPNCEVFPLKLNPHENSGMI